jgi:hypothetical protein
VGVCSGIFCSHVLEHLSLEEFRVALRRTFEHLRPGGTFRLVLPDLEHLIQCYNNDNSADAAIRFMEFSGLGIRSRKRSLARAVALWLGNSHHLWMWDEKSMIQELERQGFEEIRRAHFGDSEDLRFKEVEREDRFVGALAIQCQKG